MFSIRRAASRLAVSSPYTHLLSPKQRQFVSLRSSITSNSSPSVLLRSQRRFASDDASWKLEEQTSPQVSEQIERQRNPNATELMSEGQPPHGVQEASGGMFNRQRSPRRPSQSEGEAVPPNNVLYVGNLYFDVTNEDLTREFSKFGDVLHTRIINDPRGLSRGFGYVTFGTVEQATAAVQSLHQQLFEGRRMTVQYRRPQSRPANPSTDSFRSNRSPPSNAPSRTLFIGNMSFEMTDQDLNELFREVRNVIDVRVAIDRRTGQPRGFAHADFIDIASAEKAKEFLEEKEVYGRKLRVNYSYSTRDRSRDRSSAGPEAASPEQ